MDGAAASQSTIATPFADSTVFNVVAKVGKSTLGTSGRYDQVTLWINPSSGDELSPDKALTTLTTSIALTGISKIIVALDETEAGDLYRLHDLKIGTEWTDVVASNIPEPSTFALFGGLAVVGFAGFSRRRSGK